MTERQTSKVWYVVACGMFVIAFSIAMTGVAQFQSTIEDMRRFPMPGKAEVVLPEGPTTLYFEHHSRVEGEELRAPEDLAFHCALTDPGGRDVLLEPTASRVSYDFSGYAGRSVFDVHLQFPATYVLSCEAPARFAVAMGYGVAVWHLVALIGGLVPASGGAIMAAIIFVKRWRQRRRGATSS
jgi:hypothetical protein